ncbi:Protein-lysine N-methyltransferase efm6 [Malassezia sp. CBS 17886]|nr:Protein-lysine N-methyltransferase efm6 [Malassezia sp. CBS 17886]
MAAAWLYGMHEDDIPLSSDSDMGEACASGGGIAPDQPRSILDEHACITYFADGATAPSVAAVARGAAAPPLARTHTQYAVRLRLDMSAGCGGTIWPAAEVLGAYIASMPQRHAPRRAPDSALDGHPWRHKTVVELGSGTGLLGFFVAKIGCRCATWITDQGPMLPLMHENLALNPDCVDACHVEELNWGEPLSARVPAHPDVLLLADCVYRESAFQPLVDTMCMMATRTTEILFCYHKRRRADKQFFALLKKHFCWDDVDDDDAVRRIAYNRDGTHLYRMWG